jgi:molybdopterin-guanine dinucleotide biosynthesis protein
MILHVHREMTLSAPKRDSLRHRPARERTVTLEPKVVVEASRVVSLNHESGCRARPSRLSERLRRLPGSALAPILVEAHLWIVA